MKYIDILAGLVPHVFDGDSRRRRGRDGPDDGDGGDPPGGDPPVTPPHTSSGHSRGFTRPVARTSPPVPPPVHTDPPPDIVPTDTPPPDGSGGNNNLQNEPNRPQPATERMLTNNALGLPIPVVYGQTKIGGSICFQPTVNGGRLVTAFALSDGEIESVFSITVDGRDIGSAVINGQAGLGLVAGVDYNIHLGTAAQGVDALLHAANSSHVTGWPGLAYIAISFPPQTEATGQYDPSRLLCEVKGRKCLNPRVDLTTYTYTSNPILHIFDIMTNPTYGLGIPFANMDAAAGSSTSSWAVAADDCDFALNRTTAPGAAPTTAAPVAGGNLSGGTYAWTITYTGASGVESIESPASTPITVGAGVQVGVTWAVGPAGTTTQKLYRNRISSLGITTPRFLVSTFNNNTTTFLLDGTADSALGVQANSQYARYEMGIMMRDALSGTEWLDTLRAHCQSYLAYNTGKYQIFVDKAKSATSITFTDDNIKDLPSIRSKGLGDIPTRVVVTFSDSQNDYTEGTAQVELPGVATRLEEIRELRLNLMGVRTFDQAMRLAQLNLNRGAADRVIDFVTLADGVQPIPGDIVTVTSAVGLISTLVLVTDVQPDTLGLTWHIKGEFYDSAIYSDTVQAYPIALVPQLIPTVPAAVANLADDSQKFFLQNVSTLSHYEWDYYLGVTFDPLAALNVARYRARVGLISDAWGDMTNERVVPASYRVGGGNNKVRIDFRTFVSIHRAEDWERGILLAPDILWQVGQTSYEWKVIVRGENYDGTLGAESSVQQSSSSISSTSSTAPPYVAAQASTPGTLQQTAASGDVSFNIGGTGILGKAIVNALDAQRHGITLSNGLNSDIAAGAYTYVVAAGPTGAYSVGGFTGGEDARILIFVNNVLQTCTIVNGDASSSVGNKINTLTGSNVVLSAGVKSAAIFVWDTVGSAWNLIATNTGSGGGGGGNTWFHETPAGTVDGSNLVFTLSHTPAAEVVLCLGPSRPVPGVHYNLSGTTITYVSPYQPRTGEQHDVYYGY